MMSDEDVDWGRLSDPQIISARSMVFLVLAIAVLDEILRLQQNQRGGRVSYSKQIN